MGYQTRYTFTTIDGPDIESFRARLTDEACFDPVSEEKPS